MTICRICKVELNENNQWASDKKSNNCICKECRKQKNKANYWKNLEKRRAYYREWARNNPKRKQRNEKRREHNRAHILDTTRNGQKLRFINVEKRPFPAKCELCGATEGKIQYHHWDDKNFLKGMWLCVPCHRGASYIENDFHMRYLSLKLKIEVMEMTKQNMEIAIN